MFDRLVVARWYRRGQSSSDECVVADIGISHLPKEATDNVLEQTNSLLLHKLVDHIAEHSTDGIETFVCLADVCQTGVVEQDLLYDEYSDGLAKLRSGLHDAQA